MSRKMFTLHLGAALLLVQLPALADGIGGCVDSPESPTAVLALLGIAAGGVNRVLTRRRARRNAAAAAERT